MCLYVLMLSARMLRCFSRVHLFATLWTAARQDLLPPGKNIGVAGDAPLQGISRPRDWASSSCICVAGGFCAHGASQEALPWCVLSLHAKLLGHTWLWATPWTVAHQAPLSVGILQARMLAWVAAPASRGSSRPRGWNPCLLRLLHRQAGSWDALSFFSRAQEKMYFLKDLWLKKIKHLKVSF